jgi:hypothetical protein
MQYSSLTGTGFLIIETIHRRRSLNFTNINLQLVSLEDCTVLKILVGQ